MPLVVPCLDNIFMVLLNSELAKIGAKKPIFLNLVPLEGERGACVRGHGLLSLYSSYTKFKQVLLAFVILSLSCVFKILG